MEETSMSRRAVLDAILVARFTPVMFEAMPSIALDEVDPSSPKTYRNSVPGVARSPAPGRRVCPDLRKLRRRERDEIDDILASSEYFVGIYAESYGSSEPTLCNLRPIQYEFLRFLMQWKLREEHGDQDAADLILERWFPKDSALADDAEQEAVEIERQLALLSRALTERRTQGKRTMLEPGHQVLVLPYARVAYHRVRLYLRRRTRGGAMSTDLFHAIRNKPYEEFRHSRVPTSHDRPVYFPSAADLHRRVFQWLEGEVRPNLVIPAAVPSGHDVAITAKGTPDVPGCLTVFCQAVFIESFNIHSLSYGKDNDGADKLSVISRSFFGPATKTRRDELKARLEGALRKLAKIHDENANDSEVEVDVEPTLDNASPMRLEPLSGPSDDAAWTLLAWVADVPGMLFRVVERVASSGASIFRVGVGQSPEHKNRSSDLVERFENHRRRVELSFYWIGHSSDRTGTYRAKLLAELRFVIGVYDAIVFPFRANR